jgi:hypothetical protein
MSDVQTQTPAVPLNRFGGLLLVLVVVTLVLVYPPFVPEASPLAGLFIVQFLLANLAVVVGLLGAVLLVAPLAVSQSHPVASIVVRVLAGGIAAAVLSLYLREYVGSRPPLGGEVGLLVLVVVMSLLAEGTRFVRARA